jgi:hypothetical protein
LPAAKAEAVVSDPNFENLARQGTESVRLVTQKSSFLNQAEKRPRCVTFFTGETVSFSSQIQSEIAVVQNAPNEDRDAPGERGVGDSISP